MTIGDESSGVQNPLIRFAKEAGRTYLLTFSSIRANICIIKYNFVIISHIIPL
jgi:hypothetical protein